MSLYHNNTMIFDNFGTDLGTMSRAWSSCSGKAPLMNEILFRLGDGLCAKTGECKSQAFVNILQGLSTTVHVRRLYIVLETYHFVDSTQFKAFVSSLVRVRVHDRFGLIALPVHLQFMIEQFTKALLLEVKPVDIYIQPSSPGIIGTYHGIFAVSKERTAKKYE